jgi:SAM-dependent methyltransferase
MTTPLRFACPRCRAALVPDSDAGLCCPLDGGAYSQVDGIWRMLPPERLEAFADFIRDYETIREAEGRGAQDAVWYRALPFGDRSGRFTQDWRIRAQSYRTLLRAVIRPLATHTSLTILDLGAGNGWLSNRLAAEGHQVAAVDLLTNPRDGLGAHVHYETMFTPIQAEYDSLPLDDSQFDVAVFNGSLHYAEDYPTTLREALRVLRPGGQLVVMDSPVYRQAHSGQQMVQERERHFEQKYGFPSNALDSEHYLTHDRLDTLAETLGLRWRLHRPFYGARWALRPLRARLRGRREPAQFMVIVGTAR